MGNGFGGSPRAREPAKPGPHAHGDEEGHMRTTLKRVLLGVVSAATVAALAVPGAAFAKGPGGGGGGGGGRPGEDPAARFSLSVPALFVGTNPYGLTCDGSYRAPVGDPLTAFPVAGYYYVQGVHSWQASCREGYTAATARAEWGDNLAGDAMLKVGKPIRVEVGLFAETVDGTAVPDLTGLTVVKLEPDELDRLAKYGTEAVSDGSGGWMANPVTPFAETRVWAQGATLRIYPVGSPDDPVVSVPASAEINATGRVVYGYNLRVYQVGEYVLEFTFPGVTISGVDVGDFNGGTVQLTISVGTGGGGGGGGGPKH